VACGAIGWQRAQGQPHFLFTLSASLLVGSVALAKGWHRAWSRRDRALFYVAAAMAMWIVTLGPEPAVAGTRAFAAGPYRLLLELPGVQSIRAPARAWLPAILCLAVAAGFGTEAVIGRWPGRRRFIVAGLAMIVLSESWFNDRVVPAPRTMTLPGIPRGALVLDLPIYQGYENAEPQYRAVLSGYRALNGYSGYEPSHFQPLRRSIADRRFEVLEMFRALDDLYIIVRPGVEVEVTAWIAEQPGAVHVTDNPAGSLYRLPYMGSGARRQMPLPLPGRWQRPFLIRE
jgi:hypothetical protein